MLSDLQVKAFLDKTASGSPVPGGGSAAALNAAISASLIEMVANLTIGKKGYEDVEDKMRAIVKEANGFREKLTEKIDADADAYQQVIAAYQLPKSNDEEKKIRSRAVQDALKHASMVPFGVAENAVRLIGLAEMVVKKGNKNAVTDAAVAVLTARTAVRAALYNVKINLISIEDRNFTEDIKNQVNRLEVESMEKEKEILSGIESM